MEERKLKLAAGLLGLVLGEFGVHNFYLGFTEKAIIQLSVFLASTIISAVLLSVSIPLMLVFVGFITLPISIVLMIVAVGIRIWTFVEGIMILAGSINADAKGIQLKE